MEEEDGLPFLSTTMTGALIYHSLEEEWDALLWRGQAEQDSFIIELEGKPF